MASQALPPSLDLPPHLSAHKYFFVCTLTVAAWDTLVLSPRTWHLFKMPGWPPLKTIFHFLRFFMPIEFTIVGVAFFDTNWSQARCGKFFLFEPIATAILLAATSAIHVIRVSAIYERTTKIMALLGSLFAAQILVTGVASGFFRSVPLDVGQGCIAGPKAIWVGIYWIMPTILYLTTFALAVRASLRTLQVKHQSLWKLMLRDGLNLYATIALVNLINVLFWFIIRPTGPEDTIRTIVTSMTAVLTTTMSLRIILTLRGDLAKGGSLPGSSPSQSSTLGGTQVLSNPHGRSVGGNTAPTYMLGQMNGPESKGNEWYPHSELDTKTPGIDEDTENRTDDNGAVRIRVHTAVHQDVSAKN